MAFHYSLKSSGRRVGYLDRVPALEERSKFPINPSLNTAHGESETDARRQSGWLSLSVVLMVVAFLSFACLVYLHVTLIYQPPIPEPWGELWDGVLP